MKKTIQTIVLGCVAATLSLTASSAQELCEGYGPQTPRDITQRQGLNERLFTLAGSVSNMNLCNIHTHTNAEHRGPGFMKPAGDGVNGGWKCNNSDGLTAAELTDPTGGHGAYHGVKPGDTIEVHWVFSSCDISPGKGLGSCLSAACANPQLRVETQVFLLVNDDRAADFEDFAYDGNIVEGLHQPKSLPLRTGDPIVFAGSTTGSSYTEASCSPYQVTWSIRPNCTKLNIASLHSWAEKGNEFEEDHSHEVRPLVTALELLSPIN